MKEGKDRERIVDVRSEDRGLRRAGISKGGEKEWWVIC